MAKSKKKKLHLHMTIHKLPRMRPALIEREHILHYPCGCSLCWFEPGTSLHFSLSDSDQDMSKPYGYIYRLCTEHNERDELPDDGWQPAMFYRHEMTDEVPF